MRPTLTIYLDDSCSSHPRSSETSFFAFSFCPCGYFWNALSFISLSCFLFIVFLQEWKRTEVWFFFPSLIHWWHMVDAQDYKVHWRNTCLWIPWACVNVMFCISDCVKVKATMHQSVQRRSELLLLLPPLLPTNSECLLLLLLPSRFSRVRLCVTPETAAHQAPPSLGFSRQEHWSGLPFPSPMHESEKWNLVCYIGLIIAPISSVFVHNKCQRDTYTADSIGLWWESIGIIWMVRFRSRDWSAKECSH